jgi:hypothetical protein
MAGQIGHSKLAGIEKVGRTMKMEGKNRGMGSEKREHWKGYRKGETFGD